MSPGPHDNDTPKKHADASQYAHISSPHLRCPARGVKNDTKSKEKGESRTKFVRAKGAPAHPR